MLLSILLGSGIVLALTIAAYAVETSDRRILKIEEERIRNELKYYQFLG